MVDDLLWPTEVEERIVGRASTDRVRFLRRFLADAVSLGAQPVIPEAQAQDYLNLLPPQDRSGGRLCSVYVSTARIEFQRPAWLLAVRAGLDDAVDQIPAGDLAGIALTSAERVDVAGRMLRAMLAEPD